MGDFYSPVYTTDVLPHFPRLLCVSEDTRSTARYHIDCRNRPDNPRIFFQYTVSGYGVFRDGTGEHHVHPGFGFLAESDDPGFSYYYPAEGTDPWRFIFLDFVGESAYTLARALIARFGHLYAFPREATIIERLAAFHAYHNVGCFLSAGKSLRLVMDLLQALLEEKEAGREAHPDHELVRQARHAVQSQISLRITVSDIADQLRVSREHLTRVFTQQVGMSLGKYIQGSKVLTACALLKSGTLSIKEIASALGYDTTAHFARTFQRVMSTTPGEFKKSGTVPTSIGIKDGSVRLIP
jgi:AraC-like DNA-binding protein